MARPPPFVAGGRPFFPVVVQTLRMRDLTSTQVAAIRTAAPLIWGGLASWLLNLGFDLNAALVSATRLPEPLVVAAAPLLLSFVLWVVALLVPWSWLETLLMFVRVDSFQYGQGDTVVTPTGRVDAANVVNVDPGLAGDYQYVEASVDAILRRGVPTPVLELASTRLHDELTNRQT